MGPHMKHSTIECTAGVLYRCASLATHLQLPSWSEKQLPAGAS